MSYKYSVDADRKIASMPIVRPFRMVHAEQRAEAAREDGYLFLPGLLSRDDVMAVRENVTAVAGSHGLLRAGTLSRKAIAEPGAFMHESDATPAYQAYYKDQLSQRSVHALAKHPDLMEVMETVLGEPVLAHPRNIVRTFFPARPSITTAPHQDHRPIKGTAEVWTAWIPLGDCPEELGGLAVVPGSHRTGLHQVADGTIYFDTGNDTEWRSNPMSCGDVLLFHSLTVHQARHNATPDQIRFSCDYRYQARSKPVHEHSLLPHMGWFSWEELYANWPADDPLCFYWRVYDLDIWTNDRLVSG